MTTVRAILKTLCKKRLLQGKQLYTLKGIAAGSSNLLKCLVIRENR